MLTTLKRLGRCPEGNVAVIFGIVLPVLLGMAGLAVDSAAIYNQQSRMQGAADSTALAVAREMHLFLDNPETLEESGRARAEAMLEENGIADREHTTEVRLNTMQGHAQVEIRMAAKSFLPAEIWSENPIVVTADARIYGQVRLCILGLEEESSDTIKADNHALITAPDCAIQSNSTDPNGMSANNLSILLSAFICSSGGYDGPITAFLPLPQTDCPILPDPLALRSPPPVGGCDYLDFKVDKGAHTIQPGHYCGGLTISNNAAVTAAPGIYVISGGKLEVGNESSLVGEYVGFYFADDAATLVFKDKALVELGAPKDGPMAGILFFEDRAAPEGRAFEIASGSVRKLLGTIYLPRGIFKGDGKKALTNNPLIGAVSAYTVIVASRLELIGINLIINADYGATDVPVPGGLGPNSGVPRLTH